MTEGQLERWLEGFNETEDVIDIQSTWHILQETGNVSLFGSGGSYIINKKPMWDRNNVYDEYEITYCQSSVTWNPFKLHPTFKGKNKLLLTL